MAEASSSEMLLATELADVSRQRKGFLFGKLMPLSGNLSGIARNRKRIFPRLPWAIFTHILRNSVQIREKVLTPSGAINRKNQIGGTARKQVETSVKNIREATLSVGVTQYWGV